MTMRRLNMSILASYYNDDDDEGSYDRRDSDNSVCNNKLKLFNYIGVSE